MFRKLGAFWGTNNTDHQARICHSTTVTGVANTWGYGAMTNSFNDIRNSKTQLIMGGNPAEAHPVSLQHLLEGAELKKANVIVIDPRMTRTAAHATEYVRLRPGTDIPVLMGMMWHILKNGWEDKEFIAQRVYGFEETRKEIEKWTPEEVERVSGVPGKQLERVAKMFATEKPATLIWCMGQTQHTVGTANVRASCIALLLTGNAGISGGGANIFRGHDNVQGATDVGLDVVTLPFYYGLAEGAWKHWSRVWEVDYDYLQGRFDIQEDDGDVGHPADAVVRRRAAAEGPGRPEGQRQGDVRPGSRQQQHHAHPRIDEGAREARAAGDRRSASDDLGVARGQGGPQGRRLSVCRPAPSSRPRARASRRTARCSGASRSSSRSSSRRTTSRSCTW